MHIDLQRRGYSVDEVSSMYDMGRVTIYKEINNGNLPSVKVGKRRIITPKHLEEWEANLQEAAESQ